MDAQHSPSPMQDTPACAEEGHAFSVPPFRVLRTEKRPPVVAIIPARGGSKGLPRKNLRKLADKPLIAYSIQTALATPGIDRVVVSTDDPEIAAVARDYGAEAPFLRPTTLAGDRSLIGPAIDFCRLGLGFTGESAEKLVILYPTSPFRSVRLMELLLGKLLAGHSHVNTVAQVRYRLPIYLEQPDGGATSVLPSPTETVAPPFFRHYGVFIGSNYAPGAHPRYFHRITNEIMRVDIDSMEDFLLAEEIIRRGLFDFQEAL